MTICDAMGVGVVIIFVCMAAYLIVEIVQCLAQ